MRAVNEFGRTHAALHPAGPDRHAICRRARRNARNQRERVPDVVAPDVAAEVGVVTRVRLGGGVYCLARVREAVPDGRVWPGQVHALEQPFRRHLVAVQGMDRDVAARVIGAVAEHAGVNGQHTAHNTESQFTEFRERQVSCAGIEIEQHAFDHRVVSPDIAGSK